MSFDCPPDVTKRVEYQFADKPVLACEAAYAEASGRNRLGFNVLGKYPYKNLRVLGAGAFGKVYRAKDAVRDEIVAVKEYTDISTAAREIAMFRFVAAGGACANLPCYLAHFVHKNRAYVAMTLAPGMSGEHLQAYLKRGRVMSHRERELHLIAVMLGTSTALDFLHKNRIVHGDIKPPNIMYDPQTGNAVLIDYGGGCMLAKKAGFVKSCFIEQRIVRTKHWMSAAMIKELDSENNRTISDFIGVAIANDVFSLGITWRYLHRASLSFWNREVKDAQFGSYKWWVWVELMCTIEEPWQHRPSAEIVQKSCAAGRLSRDMLKLTKKYVASPGDFVMRHPSHISRGWRTLLRGSTKKKNSTK